MAEKSDHYVYAYFDPDSGEPFYIGKGKGKRARWHLMPSSRARRTYFYNKVRKLVRLGKPPIIRMLLTGITDEESLTFESFFILAIGRLNDPNNPGPLLNLTNGGEGLSGMVHSQSTRALMSAKMKGRPNNRRGATQTKAAKALISLAVTKRWADPVFAKIRGTQIAFGRFKRWLTASPTLPLSESDIRLLTNSNDLGSDTTAEAR